MIKLATNVGAWTSIFKSLERVCKETRLNEFQVKGIHRVAIVMKEICKFGIKTEDECLFVGLSTTLSTLTLNVRLQKKKSYRNGFVKLFVVRSP